MHLRREVDNDGMVIRVGNDYVETGIRVEVHPDGFIFAVMMSIMGRRTYYVAFGSGQQQFA